MPHFLRVSIVSGLEDRFLSCQMILTAYTVYNTYLTSREIQREKIPYHQIESCLRLLSSDIKQYSDILVLKERRLSMK